MISARAISWMSVFEDDHGCRRKAKGEKGLVRRTIELWPSPRTGYDARKRRCNKNRKR
jgi:hypothetical protein